MGMVTIEEARAILGQDAESLADQELEDLMAKFEYLADCWLETYEKKAFKRSLNIDNESQ